MTPTESTTRRMLRDALLGAAIAAVIVAGFAALQGCKEVSTFYTTPIDPVRCEDGTVLWFFGDGTYECRDLSDDEGDDE